MSLYKINSGVDTSFSTKLNSNTSTSLRQSGRNTIRQLQDRDVDFSGDGGEWAEAYTDSNGRKNSVDTSSTTATFDTDKYKSSDVFVEINASSISSVSDFAINDCKITNTSSNTWILTCDSGTVEEKRAKIYKTLFYGTDGTDPRASSTYITSITALKTNVSRDVGKKAYLRSIQHSPETSPVNDSSYIKSVATLSSPGNDVSVWSLSKGSVNHVHNGSVYNQSKVVGRISIDNTLVNEVTVPDLPEDMSCYTVSNNEFGTDTTSDEVNNPSSIELKAYCSDSGNYDCTCSASAFFLAEGSVSWANTNNTWTFNSTNITVDFNGDNSIPAFTSVSENSFIITQSIPSGTFSSTISSAFGTALVRPGDWEDGASIQYKLTNASEDTGWLNTNEVATFTAFTSEPTKCIVKLVPKSSSPTSGYPAIKGFSVFE